MKEIGNLFETDGRFEFRSPKHSLVIRGDHPEWVLHAASEVLSNSARLASEGEIDELETLVEFGECTEIEVESAKFRLKERFEIIPQCIVSMGRIDYKWIAQPGREIKSDEFGDSLYQRIQDISLTYGDTFTKNEEGVDMADSPDNSN